MVDATAARDRQDSQIAGDDLPTSGKTACEVSRARISRSPLAPRVICTGSDQVEAAALGVVGNESVDVIADVGVAAAR
jgi:hypothetical protein